MPGCGAYVAGHGSPPSGKRLRAESLQSTYSLTPRSRASMMWSAARVTGRCPRAAALPPQVSKILMRSQGAECSWHNRGTPSSSTPRDLEIMGSRETLQHVASFVASTARLSGSGPRIEVRSGGAWASKYAKPLHYQVRACTGGRSSPSNAYGDPARQRRNEGKTLSFRGAAWSWNFSPAEFWPGARNSADRARRRKSPTACTATCGSSGRTEIAVGLISKILAHQHS